MVGNRRDTEKMPEKPLADRRILVVEDEFLIADELCRSLENAGAVVIGPAKSVDLALDLITAENDIDAALLDVKLSGEVVYPVAEALVVRSVPFVFTSSLSEDVLAEHYSLMPRCQKPTDFTMILQELEGLMTEVLEIGHSPSHSMQETSPCNQH